MHEPFRLPRKIRTALHVTALLTAAGGISSARAELQPLARAWRSRPWETNDEPHAEDSHMDGRPAIDLFSATTTALRIVEDADVQLLRVPRSGYDDDAMRAIMFMASMGWRDQL